MTNEEMQKAMAFIVDQQVQTFVKIDTLADAHGAAEVRWSRTEEGIRALLTIAEIHERETIAQGEQIGAQSEQIGAQSEQIAAHTEQIAAHTEQILGLREATRNTDERLNVLINIVERQISEGRNGKP
jgi:hypothetical protein